MSSIETHAHATDPRLRGRTYAIPFDAVWTAALDVVAGTRGWTLVSDDDQAGTIHVEAGTLLLRQTDDLFLRVGLDEDAQTRVDLRGDTRAGKPDLGRKRRVAGRFFRRLDRALDARDEQILDPTLPPSWSS